MRCNFEDKCNILWYRFHNIKIIGRTVTQKIGAITVFRYLWILNPVLIGFFLNGQLLTDLWCNQDLLE